MNRYEKVLKQSLIDTLLGPMMAIADENALYLLEFLEWRGLKREVEKLALKTQSSIISGVSDPISLIEHELKKYFEGNLTEFSTPYVFLGTPFQQQVWEELRKIPFAQTRSYVDVAFSVGRPKACRAVARANGANRLALIIPCHRVINASGQIGGYGGGVCRKQWLLNHEEKVFNK